MRLQSPMRIEDQFLRGQPAHALDEGTFDLPDIDRRIERAADIVKDIDAIDPHFAGQGIDRDFRAGRAIGEIEEWPALGLVRDPNVIFGVA